MGGLSGANYFATPYTEVGSKEQRLSNGTCRHIADYMYALDGWDGSKYLLNGSHAAERVWRPFICGYDSDEENQLDQINMATGKSARMIRDVHECSSS